MELTPLGIYMERDVYNCFDLVGDLGGVSGIFVTLFGYICYPYAHYAYNLKVSKKLFKARTKDKNMFNSKYKHKCIKDNTISAKMLKELDKHYTIALKKKDYIFLFWS